MTKLTFLSHASCLVTSGKTRLLMDPWLIGSCYWRSWWNYPPVKDELLEDLNVDMVYITHVHWDHWHGPTLKKFISKETLIITHDEPNSRSIKDLHKLGYENTICLKHGESFELGEIKITPYQFGLFLNDSCLVVEAPGLNLLNANDCKIAGIALRDIVKKHGPFDFALRSHSSANDRVCYSIDGKSEVFDDSLHYSRAFTLFMDAVKPKYAVPFASNHCHLHKDVFSMNHLVNDPYKLQNYIKENNLLNGSEFKVMLTGDSWSSDDGFNISAHNQDFFENKASHIGLYQQNMQSTLEKYYKLENNSKINDSIIGLFRQQIAMIPKFLRKQFGEYEYKMILFNDINEWQFRVKPKDAIVEPTSPNDNFGSVIKIPVKIFIDAVALNMFHHSSISKRNKYIFSNEEEMKKYEKFQDLLEYVELEVFPLRFSYFLKLFNAYRRRWREVLVYMQAYLLKRKGMKIYHIEEEILKGT